MIEFSMEKIMKELIEKNKKTILILSVLVLILIIGLFFRKYVYSVDYYILNIIRNFVTEKLTICIKFITNIASIIVLCAITMVALIFIKNKRIGFLIFVNLIIATLFNYTLKFIFSRERPFEYMLIDESGYSFPSGHSMVAMAFYGFLIYLCTVYIMNKKVKNIIVIVLSILIILIGFSRVYLGVHYPSDVIVGLYLGFLYLNLFISFINKKRILINKQ